MLLIRSQVYNLLMYFAILVIGIYHMPAAIRSKEGVYKAVRMFGRTNRWLLKNICGITYEVRGEVPTEPCIICAKHMSFLDICILGEVVPEFKFVMKKQVKYMPIVGFFASRVGSAPVARGKQGGARQMMKDLKKGEELNETGQLVIYPQGTRTLPNENLPYKKGAWYIYKDKNLPVYLAANNIGVLWARRSLYRYPGHIVVEFLPGRIEAGMELEPFMELMAEKIETRSNELMAEYPRGYKA